jgi:hypothetical protein
MSRIAVIPFMRSRTTPVAPVCAVAAAAIAEAVSVIVIFARIAMLLPVFGFCIGSNAPSDTEGRFRAVHLLGTNIRDS